jgi:hypothetical protein
MIAIFTSDLDQTRVSGMTCRLSQDANVRYLPDANKTKLMD